MNLAAINGKYLIIGLAVLNLMDAVLIYLLTGTSQEIFVANPMVIWLKAAFSVILLIFVWRICRQPPVWMTALAFVGVISYGLMVGQGIYAFLTLL